MASASRKFPGFRPVSGKALEKIRKDKE